MNAQDKKEGIVSDPLDIIQEPFRRFLKRKAAGGILLIGATIIALILANSHWADIYKSWWNKEILIGINSLVISKPIISWINDGFMAIFFFLIGLEIKRELMYGELSSPKKAILPIIAAIGGMIFPALIFLLFNNGTENIRGWGIPTATDIAYSLGILSLLGKRVPISMNIFLATFAIVDDIGAVVIIALFYSTTILWNYFLLALCFILVLFLINRMEIKKVYLYAIIGIIVWYLFLKAGIHPTIAGVIVAFTIPTHRKIRIKEFVVKFKQFLYEFYGKSNKNAATLNDIQMASIDSMQDQIQKVVSPLQLLEHDLYGFVIFFIVPLFAFANAGVEFDGVNHLTLSLLPVSIAISLVLGKFIGIFTFSYLATKLHIATLPKLFTLKHLVGSALLGGIGFTMSLFICNLSYKDSTIINEAKFGVLIGSTIAAILALVVTKTLARKEHKTENVKE